MRSTKNKYGQLKIQQMSFMLLATFLFLMFVALFYFGFKLSNLDEASRNLEIDRGVKIADKITSTPELNFENQPNSIDFDKLVILKSNSRYKELVDYGVIVQKIYPDNSSSIECTSGNYPNCNIVKINTAKSITPISSFVALCRKESESGRAYSRCEIAKLMIDLKEAEDE